MVHGLADEAWRADDAPPVAAAAAAHTFPLDVTLLGVAARLGDQTAYNRLVDDARNGSIDALRALAPLRDLPADVAAAQIAKLADQVTKQIADAHRGQFGLGVNVGRVLTELNLEHPEHARWDPILRLLADERVGTAGRGALRVLYEHADGLPEAIRGDLVSLAIDLTARRRDPDAPDSPQAHRALTREATLLAAALGAFDDHRMAAELTALMTGGKADRMRAMAFAARRHLEGHVGVLIALTTDAHADTRAWAAALLAE